MGEFEGNSPEIDPAVLGALYLGRVQASLSQASDGTLRVLAGRLIRECLVTALRQEGHSFTDERFFDWFAGLSTLSDVSAHKLRAPRSLCQAILTEFQHNPWRQLAEASQKLADAFLAPVDLNANEGHEDAHALIAEARALIAEIAEIAVPDTDLPFGPLAALFTAARQSPRFSRQERGIELIRGPRSSIAVETSEHAHSRWALDILAGTYLSPLRGLPLAAPLPGLLTFKEATSDPFDDDLTFSHHPSLLDRDAFAALRDALWSLDRRLIEARADAELIREGLQGRRSNGRAGDVAYYLAGFGKLRGAQIERIIGASRLGVRTIMATLSQSGVVRGETSRNAATMYRFAPLEADQAGLVPDKREFAFSPEAIDDFESSMGAIDDLLRRISPEALDDED
ncbi:hypothetical protein [Novosphingobium pentaromativorans]|uniref:Uncharacterized protein n=1 Tax=Novosphingobium pentaromativorans US6-1 TaxID=1088721 RepID=G6EFW5_9SPHN|nr:hypothetical protein [Novosphingobium pentaromativorans]AIT81778.1 hypothetical protein JI59_19405 [Novosphingobium pentaromativorans US6-1]EHJ59654.1 hypothetical protein NSU_3236 [Novosphingobium pentaromativorans US6-1]